MDKSMNEKFYYRGVNKGALLHQWLNLLSSGLDSTRSCFKKEKLRAFCSNENFATHISEF